MSKKQKSWGIHNGDGTYGARVDFKKRSGKWQLVVWSQNADFKCKSKRLGLWNKLGDAKRAARGIVKLFDRVEERHEQQAEALRKTLADVS